LLNNKKAKTQMAERSGQKISQFYLDDIWQVFGRRKKQRKKKKKLFVFSKQKKELLTFGGGKKTFPPAGQKSTETQTKMKCKERLEI
jgi:hypothetical protein